MAPERLSACVETLAQLAGLDKVSTRLCQFMCVVVEWVWSPRTSFRHTDIHVHSHKDFCNLEIYLYLELIGMVPIISKFERKW